MTSRRRRHLSAIWLLSVLLFAGCGPTKSTPEPKPAGPPLPAKTVSGEKALELTSALVAIGPRYSGSPGAEAAAKWLAKACGEVGVEATIDEWQEDTATGSITFRNVIAEIPGTAPGFIVLGSHYDSKLITGHPDFVGANDGGSSSGLLIALLEQLATPGYWRGPTIRAVFFDGEEARLSYSFNDGLHGSRREAKRAAAASPPCRAMILMDMIGDRDLHVTFPPNCDRELVRRVFRLSEQQGTRTHFGHYVLGNLLDDHTPFVQQGIPAINFIDFSYGPRNKWWHTGDDTLDKLDAKSLEIVGNAVLALLADLASD